jgi:nucleotide-binding universal stress UspA family protein
VPTDFSEHAQRAFERASDLAAALGAKLYLLHVQSASALRVAVQEGLLDDASTDEQIERAVEELIEQRFSQTMSGVTTSHVEKVLRRGDPAAVIIAFAEEIGADLIAVGRRGAGLIEDVRATVLGSVAASVIRKSPCPVLVVRREHKERG